MVVDACGERDRATPPCPGRQTNSIASAQGLTANGSRESAPDYRLRRI